MQNLKIYKASAGSGKTYILTQEYLKLAFKSPDKFKSILAVTFTNKAAEEMKERIILELNNLISKGKGANLFLVIRDLFPGFSDVQIIQRALSIRDCILHNYSYFSIGTIDSFVQRVVRAFAYEIGVRSGYKIELDNNKVIDELTQLLTSKIINDKILCKWLVNYSLYKVDEGKNWDYRQDVRYLANEIFKERFQSFNSTNYKSGISGSNDGFGAEKDVLELYQNDLLKIKGRYEDFLMEIGHQAQVIIENNAIDYTGLGRNFGIVCNFLLNKLTNPQKADYEPVDTIFNILDNVGSWYAKKAKKEIISQIEKVYSGLNELLHKAINEYESNYKDFLTACNILGNFHSFGILNDLAILLPEYREENNLLLISDTTLFLKRIINNNDAPFIYEKVGNRYQHILIDEFQDTSGFQWENFRPLIKNSIAEGHFNLIVGDIKQSIYRWRGGDWKLLLQQVGKDISNENIDQQSLDTNWRSRKNVIDFNNSLFDYIPKLLQNQYNAELSEIPDVSEKLKMGDAGYGEILINAYEDSYQKIAPSENNRGGRVKICFFKQKGRSPNQWHSNVVESLPYTINELLKSGKYSPKDITILVRKNNEGKEVIDLLLNFMAENQDVLKYSLISAESLYIANSHVVLILIAALHYIHNEQNEIQVAILLNEYQKIIKKLDCQHFHSLDIKDKDQLKEVLPSEFIDNIDELRKLSLFELVERLIFIFELYSYSNQYPYLRAFQDAVLEFTRTEISDLDAFLTYWKDEGGKYSIQMSDKHDAVKVMSIHKSKGLAFKVVIIPYCDWKLDHTNYLTSPVIWCKPEKEPFNKFSYLPLRYKSDLAKTIFATDYFDEKLYSYMDALNMLYVSFTRAVDELLVFAPINEKGKLDSVADLLYQAVQDLNEEITINSKHLISLSSGFNPEDLIYENNLEYLTSFSSVPENGSGPKNDFDIGQYPSFNWRDKISIYFNSENFFIETEEYRAEKINYGTLMHEVLSKIKSERDIDQAIEEMYHASRIGLEEKNNLRKKVVNLINQPTVKEWFSDHWEVRTESALLTQQGKIKIPDRILFGSDKTIIIDFKFGEFHAEHTTQVREYMDLLKGMNYANVEGVLYYADKNEIVRV